LEREVAVYSLADLHAKVFISGKKASMVEEITFAIAPNKPRPMDFAENLVKVREGFHLHFERVEV
jgi:hypothetical protein